MFSCIWVPFFCKQNKTPTVLCCFSSERSIKPSGETFQNFLFTLSLRNWSFGILRKHSSTKSNAFFVLLLILCFFKKKISSVHQKCTVFQVLLKTNSYFCCTSFLDAVWVRKPTKGHHPVPDHFDGSEDLFSERLFWITVRKASKEQSKFFGTKSNLKGSPLTCKATSGYFGQSVWNWIKGNVPTLEKIRPDAKNKNFIWITCGSR